MGKFKKHMMIVNDGTIHFFRSSGDSESRQQHSLKSCHVRVTKTQKVDDGKGNITLFYPVQADVPPASTRILYFESEEL